MIRVVGCIVSQHDHSLVVLAFFICVLACNSAVGLLARAEAADRKFRTAWLGITALVFGSGIWSTHFVGMLAFRPGLPLGFDLGLTGTSILAAILLSLTGFFVVLLGRKLYGGMIIGTAIGTMHFTGMLALRAPATEHWRPDYVLAALIIGPTFSALAMTYAGRLENISTRLKAAGLLTLAICGLHFTAMSALTLEPDPFAPVPTNAVFAQQWIAISIAATVMLVVGLGFASSAIDQHLAARNASEAERLRRHVLELETATQALERKTVEVTLALEAAAAASQAKSQFLAAMSHELRTPLNAIIGFSEIIAREIFGSVGHSRYIEYAKNILDSGGHLLGLINDVLDFSKLEAGRFELQEDGVDIAATMLEAVNMLGQQAEKSRLRLMMDAPANMPLLRADRRRVRQVLLNLLSNSIKFTPEGGEIRLSAATTATGTIISVSDTGIGMAAEDIPTALDRFGQIDSRLNRKFNGTGLGLPLSKRLVELHGGTLDIDSAVGAGTTVTIRFPADRTVEGAQVA